MGRRGLGIIESRPRNAARSKGEQTEEFGGAAANEMMKMREWANMGNADRERMLEADGRGVRSADPTEDCGEHRRPEAEPGIG